MPGIKIISVDLQKEFSAKSGKHYRSHSNVDFIKNILVPFLRENNIKIAEIVSDYRQPRPGDLDKSNKARDHRRSKTGRHARPAGLGSLASECS